MENRLGSSRRRIAGRAGTTASTMKAQAHDAPDQLVRVWVLEISSRVERVEFGSVVCCGCLRV